MMKIKPGVGILGVKPEMMFVLVAADSVFTELDADCIVTSCTEARHGRGSKHYGGYALDFRTRHLTKSVDEADGMPIRAGRRANAMIRDALGPDFDVVFETDHIHVEYDPKEPDG